VTGIDLNQTATNSLNVAGVGESIIQTPLSPLFFANFHTRRFSFSDENTIDETDKNCMNIA
jgi:hypothetical protein